MQTATPNLAGWLCLTVVCLITNNLITLDVQIIAVNEHAEGLELVLEARDPRTNPAGQLRMIIINPTIIPLIGDTLWGGMGKVLLQSGDIEFPYRREGYSRLIQDWPPSKVDGNLY